MNNSNLFKKLVKADYFSALGAVPIQNSSELVKGKDYFIIQYGDDDYAVVYDEEVGDNVDKIIHQISKQYIARFVAYGPNQYSNDRHSIRAQTNFSVEEALQKSDKNKNIRLDQISNEPKQYSNVIYDLDLIKQKLGSLKNNANLSVALKRRSSSKASSRASRASRASSRRSPSASKASKRASSSSKKRTQNIATKVFDVEDINKQIRGYLGGAKLKKSRMKTRRRK
jgi:hypothetical protein